MILDGSKVDAGSDLSFDICIVGSGASALTIAKALSAEKLSVCVLESSFDDLRDSRVQKPYTYDKHPRWYGGEEFRRLDKGVLVRGSTLKKVRSDFFTSSRTRSFGGSTNCWEGLVRPYDAHDFDRWPISRNDLRVYYEQVMQTLELGYFDWFDEPGNWKELALEDIEPFKLPEGSPLKTVVCQQQTDLDIIELQNNFKGLFSKNKNLTLIRNATCVDIEIDYPQEIELKSVTCVALDKVSFEAAKTFKVRAKQFVLAMGGLEIPRFLKMQFARHQMNYPRVGQNYMNQAKYLVAGFAKLASPINPKIRRFYQGQVPLRTNDTVLLTPYIVPTSSALEKYGINNFAVKLNMMQAGTIFFEIEFEQEPNQESTIQLEDELVDSIGQPVVKLDWRFKSKDRRTLTRACELIISTLSSVIEMEDFRYIDWSYDHNPDLPEKDMNYQPVQPQNSHLGTVRMNSADGVDDGVLDSDLKFKGFTNLWIISTAAFPSGGWAPPTLTLMAMALRLSDKLKSIRE